MLSELSKKLDLIFSEDNLGTAFKYENELKEFIKNSTKTEEKNEAIELFFKLENYLLPYVPQKQFETLIGKNFLDLLRFNGNSVKENIKSRLLPYPDDSQDYIQLEILKILLSSEETLGSLAIEEWLKNYDKSAQQNKPTSMERASFIEKNEQAKKLSPADKTALLKLLDLFDYIKPEFDYKHELKNMPVTSRESKKTDSFLEKKSPDKQIEVNNLVISDALKKYPTLGEQLITSDKIKLKNFPEPARPSIKNWLSDYTFNMGHNSHDAMTRGNYLFQNENSRRLNPSDREKLSYVLKAYDENSEITVNVNTRQIIFPRINDQRARNNERGTMSNEQRTMNNSNSPKADSIVSIEPHSPDNAFSESKFFQKRGIQAMTPEHAASPATSRIGQKPSQNIQDTKYQIPDTKLSFTSPQKMPYESQKQNYPPPKEAFGPSPLRITPMGFKKDSEKNSDGLSDRKDSPKNVVNLKDN